MYNSNPYNLLTVDQSHNPGVRHSDFVVCIFLGSRPLNVKAEQNYGEIIFIINFMYPVILCIPAMWFSICSLVKLQYMNYFKTYNSICKFILLKEK